MKPKLILMISGKRKCGKDYLCCKLKSILKNDYSVKFITLSAPLKKAYALENNLDYEKLLDSSDYKETYRADMIRWGENKRLSNPWFFCELATDFSKTENETKPIIWIITDTRRQTDIAYFRHYYSNQVKLIRVISNDNVRRSRKWEYIDGIDNAVSECDLDEITEWDMQILNNDENELNSGIEQLLQLISLYMCDQ